MSWTTTSHRFSLILGLVFVLQACGGGGGGGGDPTPPTTVPNADPKGYYNNTGSAALVSGNLTDLQGMIHNNRLIMLSANAGLSYDGTIAITGNNYTGTLSVYDDGTLLGTAPVTGVITQGQTVTGTLTGTGAGSGTFTLNYAANNSEAAALSAVQRSGNWFAPVGGSTTEFAMSVRTNGDIIETVMTDGIFGGCSMVGSIAPVSGTHLYTVSLTLSSCNPKYTLTTADGTYTGLATTRTQNSGTPNDRLLFVVTNGTYSLSNEFYP